MTANTTGTEQARHFLRGVEAACADLAPAERARLLAGLDEHLGELSAEGVDLTAELGDPADYAQELRATAGLPIQGTGSPGTLPTGALQAGALQTGALLTGPAPGVLPAVHPGAAATGHGDGPGIRKAVLVVAAVLGGLATLVAATVLIGGFFLFGSTVSSVESSPVMTAPPLVTVPEVIGLTEQQARQALTDAGLTVIVTREPAEIDPGTTFRQDPAAGSYVDEGAAVQITVNTASTP